MAGLDTLAGDPPPNMLSRSSAVPKGTFPDSKVTFRLSTPVDKGIGVRLNYFRPPESHPMKVVFEDRAGNFGRGRGPCSHYRHMQQRAKYLVPMLPTQSRVDELHRVQADAKHHELRRMMTLDALELNEARRQARLRQAKTLLQNKSSSREISQRLQASCSLPDLESSCGEQTNILQLLNRRVDYNRIKKCRSDLAQQQKSVMVKTAILETPELKELMDDINSFEHKNLPDVSMVLETIVDWKDSTAISFNQDGSVVHSKEDFFKVPSAG